MRDHISEIALHPHNLIALLFLRERYMETSKDENAE